MNAKTLKAEVLVLGSGPGGYTAAFRAADLGKQVVLVERYKDIGGVCLNVGCIPSKALLHIAEILNETKNFAGHGVTFNDPQIDAKKIINWKNSVIKKLTGGLAMLAKRRKVEIVTGVGQFTQTNQLEVKNGEDITTIEFQHAIIAAGSEAIKLPFLPDDPRIFTSTGALNLSRTKGNMLVIGGGIIGLEMATVYAALGVDITVVEALDQLIPGADLDLVKPLQKHMSKNIKNIMLKTRVTNVDAQKSGLQVSFEGKQAPDKPQKFDQILVAVGRRPNGRQIGAEHAGVQVDDSGFITVDKQMRTNVPHIYAIGDIAGQPMLAHKAIPEGKVAAEVIAGKKHYFNPRCIASVAYTDPEVAWAGITEKEAIAQGINFDKGIFPWAASGRALSLGRDEGITKVIFDVDTNQIIGAGIVGPRAGDLIAEAALAIEMGCDAEDIALTIHPHPTLSETLAGATEAFTGEITDLYMPKAKNK